MTLERHSNHPRHSRSASKRLARAWEKLPYRRRRFVIKLLAGIGVSLVAAMTGVVIAHIF